ncbi:MAG: acetylserotonin O-methyltransferase [Lentisphaeraceae bacterium]|nr:acetylserotonin O-methyltransferase [Lentisphaeraceae bacterium]
MPLQLPEIVSLASAYYGSAVLFAALELDLFTALARTADPTAPALAAELGADPRGLELLLNGAVAVGLLTKSGERFALTEASAAALVRGAPHDLTRAIAYNRDVYPAWGRLADLARTGRPVEAPALHLGSDRARTRTFALSMHGRALGIGRAVIPALGLSPGARILDLAGGPGTYALLMAQADPTCTVDTYDLPAIAEVAREITAPCADRISCHAGDYHQDTYPAAAYDVVTLFGCLHQESPEQIVDILRRAAAALRPGGRLYVLDMMTGPDHTTPPFSALFALNMALTTDHGWVFSAQELEGWMQQAGLSHFSCEPIPPPMPHWLASAQR